MNIKDLNVGEVIENVDLSRYTTYKLAGIGRVLVIPRDIDGLKKLIDYIKSNGVKYKILGNGSNLIFKNDFFPKNAGAELGIIRFVFIFLFSHKFK